MSDIINDLTFTYAFRIDPVAEVTADVRWDMYVPVKLLKGFVPSSYYIVLGYGVFVMPYFEKISDDKFKTDMALTLKKGDFIYNVSPECKTSYNDKKFELAVESILHITNAMLRNVK